MKKNIFKHFGYFAVVVIIAFTMAACGNPTGGNPSPSSNATLSGITIKGQAASSLGTPNAAPGSAERGTGIIKDDDIGQTNGTVAHSGASVTKIVQYAEGETANQGNFTSSAAYNNENINDNDFFMFEVTAEDGSKLYYRITVRVADFRHELSLDGPGSNIQNAENSANVRFFVNSEISSDFYDSMTYTQAVALLGEPVTNIYSLNVYDEGFSRRLRSSSDVFLYALEFTSTAASATLVKAGSASLTGTESDKDIQVDMNGITVITPPEITGFTFTPLANLRIGNANTAASATAGNFSAVTGGTAPFSYSLVSGSGAADNALFIIDDIALKVGNSALTTAKTYYVRVRVTDSMQKTYDRELNFPVLPPMPAPSNIKAEYQYHSEPMQDTTPSRVFIRLSWDSVEGAERYDVYYSDSINGEYTGTYIGTATHWDFGLSPEFEFGKLYYFKVAASMETGEPGTPSAPVALTLPEIRQMSPNVKQTVNITNPSGGIVWFVVNRDPSAGARYYFWADNVTGQAVYMTNTNFTIAYTGPSGERTSFNYELYSDFAYSLQPIWGPAFGPNTDDKIYIVFKPTAAQSFEFMYNQDAAKPMTLTAPSNFYSSEGYTQTARLMLYWDRKDGASAGYEIWRSDSENGMYELSGTVNQTTTGAAISYYEGSTIISNPHTTFSTIEPGQTYWYKVYAKTHDGAITAAAGPVSATANDL